MKSKKSTNTMKTAMLRDNFALFTRAFTAGDKKSAVINAKIMGKETGKIK
jgi:hypothetical protein